MSTAGGSEAIWSRDGRELFYRCGGAVMRARVQTERGFSVDTPEELLRGPYVEGAVTGLPSYDVLPGGEQFVMISESRQQSPPAALVVVLEWFTELARLTGRHG